MSITSATTPISNIVIDTIVFGGNQTVDFDCTNASTVRLVLTGTFNGGISFKSSIDGTTFLPLLGIDQDLLNGQVYSDNTQSASTPDGSWKFDVGGAQLFRVQASAPGTSGSSSIAIAGTTTASVLTGILDEIAVIGTIKIEDTAGLAINLGQQLMAASVPVVISSNQSTINVKDASAGSVVPGTVATNSELMGGQFNTVLPTLTDTQQSAIQLDASGRQIVAPLTNTSIIKAQLQDNAGNALTSTSSALDVNLKTSFEDKNFGTVGASTLRTAAEIGNATGAADFNFGTVGAQTLRTAAEIGNAAGIADFNTGATGAQTIRVEANQGTANTTPWNENISQIGGSAVVTGTGISGLGVPRVTVSNDSNVLTTQSGTWTVQPGNTQNTTTWLTQDAADGPVIPGTVANKSVLTGGQYNQTLPSLTTAQQAAIQLDSNGRLITIENSGNLFITADILDLVLIELRTIRLAVTALACDGGRNKPTDFDPSYNNLNHKNFN